MTTPYEVSDSKTKALIPARGPCREDEAQCVIRLHHKRKRKTGPPWKWVAVARCAPHRRSFTVYPPGHVPYGRVPFVVLAPDGSEVAPSNGDRPSGFMEAAADARDGKRWPPEKGASGVRTTQRRRVRAAASLLGLISDLEPTPAVAAGVLGIAEGGLAERRQALSCTRDLTIWARSVCGLVVRLTRGGRMWLMDRLALLGHLAGWWGRPWRWLPRTSRLIAQGGSFWASPDAGTRGRSPP